jgi:hypothetical protein
MKTPNRYERMVLKALKQDDVDEDVGVVLTGAEVVALLRRQHRAYVRMVQRIGDGVEAGGSAISAILTILAALKRKGKR